MSSICCPVCLGEIGDVHDERVMRMPVCGHLIHTACALSAAQYDTRCPMCRSHDPSIVVREDGSRGDVNAALPASTGSSTLTAADRNPGCTAAPNVHGYFASPRIRVPPHKAAPSALPERMHRAR